MGNLAGGSNSEPSSSPHTPMDERTLTALQGSIEKWKAIEAGTGADDGWRNCPLCQLFNHPFDERRSLGCRGCPVYATTRLQGCEGTPYEPWSVSSYGLYPRVAQGAKLIAIAREEREFLESLLP